MTTHHRWARAFVFAGLFVLASPAVHAADTYGATITGDAQKVALAHGLAWIDGKGQVSVGLYQTPPDAKERARALEDGGAIFGVFDVPNVKVDLTFKEGTARAELASFESCHIRFSRFEIGIFDWNAFGSGCGPVEFSGDLRPGAVVHGKLKGRAEAYPRSDGTKPTYSWDLAFTATLIAKP